MVMQVPGGAGEGFAGREFDEDGVDVAVHVVYWLVGEAGDQFLDDEGDEEMLVVDVVESEHGAAVEQELFGEGHEAEVFEREAQGLVWAFRSVLGTARAGGGGDDAGEDKA